MSPAAVCPGGPRLKEGKQSLGEKKICVILLLIIATCCVSGSAFVVNVTQSCYQAEESQNITLEWSFTVKPGSSLSSLSVICVLLTEHNASSLYHLHEGLEVPESQDERFAGRVRCDRGVLGEGRIRLHVSGLRTADSGLCLCKVSTDYGMSTAMCRLNVTAGDEPEPQRPRMRREPESRVRPVLYAGLGLTAATLLVVCAKIYSRGCQRNCPSGLTGDWRAAFLS